MAGEFIVGNYTATWNALACGELTNQGFQLSHRFFKRPITGDSRGQTVQNRIYQGRETFIRMTMIEFIAAAVASLIEPYATVVGTRHTLGVVGTLDVGYTGVTGKSKSLILTVVSGTPASDKAAPTSMTFPLSIISDQAIQLLYANDLREVPVQMDLYPDVTTGVFGTET